MFRIIQKRLLLSAILNLPWLISACGGDTNNYTIPPAESASVDAAVSPATRAVVVPTDTATIPQQATAPAPAPVRHGHHDHDGDEHDD